MMDFDDIVYSLLKKDCCIQEILFFVCYHHPIFVPMPLIPGLLVCMRQ